MSGDSDFDDKNRQDVSAAVEESETGGENDQNQPDIEAPLRLGNDAPGEHVDQHQIAEMGRRLRLISDDVNGQRSRRPTFHDFFASFLPDWLSTALNITRPRPINPAPHVDMMQTDESGYVEDSDVEFESELEGAVGGLPEPQMPPNRGRSEIRKLIAVLSDGRIVDLDESYFLQNPEMVNKLRDYVSPHDAVDHDKREVQDILLVSEVIFSVDDGCEKRRESTPEAKIDENLLMPPPKHRHHDLRRRVECRRAAMAVDTNGSSTEAFWKEENWNQKKRKRPRKKKRRASHEGLTSDYEDEANAKDENENNKESFQSEI